MGNYPPREPSSTGRGHLSRPEAELLISILEAAETARWGLPTNEGATHRLLLDAAHRFAWEQGIPASLVEGIVESIQGPQHPGDTNRVRRGVLDGLDRIGPDWSFCRCLWVRERATVVRPEDWSQCHLSHDGRLVRVSPTTLRAMVQPDRRYRVVLGDDHDPTVRVVGPDADLRLVPDHRGFLRVPVDSAPLRVEQA